MLAEIVIFLCKLMWPPSEYNLSLFEGISLTIEVFYGTAYLPTHLCTLHKLTNRNLTWFKQLTVQTNRKTESNFRCVGKYHLPYFIIGRFLKEIIISEAFI